MGLRLFKRMRAWKLRRTMEKQLEDVLCHFPLSITSLRYDEYWGGKTMLLTQMFLEQERKILQEKRKKEYEALVEATRVCRHSWPDVEPAMLVSYFFFDAKQVDEQKEANKCNEA